MAISNITPASTNVIEAGDTFAFDVDDTYTSMVIEVETDSGWEYAYDSALGGQQTGYTVVVADDGAGTHTFTVGRDSGFDLADTNVKVTEDETGSSAETSFSYSLATQQLFPRGKSPYFGTFTGNLRISNASTTVRSDVGWIDLIGFSTTDSGTGKVTINKHGAKTTVTLAASDATFAVPASPFIYLVGDGLGNTITTITGGHEGQIITVLFADGLVAFSDDNTHAADTLDMAGGYSPGADYTIQLIYDGTSWYELSRAGN